MENRTECPRCHQVLDEHGICHYCGYRIDDPYQGHPMKWYQFVIYVQLFANIISNALTGVSLFTGSVFGEGAYHIHELFPFMLVFNRIMAIAFFGLCFVTVFAWRQLKYLRKDAPFYLRITRLLGIGLGLISSLGMLIISDIGIAYLLSDVRLLSNILTVAIMIILEKKYFDNRSDIFIY